MNNPKTLVSIVIPVFNEEGGMAMITDKIADVFSSLPSFDYEVICVDDGSSDGSLNEIEGLYKKNPKIKFISFSRNFGHQSAVKAGLDYSSGDCAISMDADMQHPPELIEEMLKKWQEGYDVVYTIRLRDKKLPFIKRMSSRFYYKTINSLSDIKIDDGAADFRLLDRKVVDILKNLTETKLFLRGMISWLGFSQYAIEYLPGERAHGETKYSFKRMISLALNGITSFSVKPLRIAAWIGLVTASVSFIYGLYALYGLIWGDLNLKGWTSLIVSVIFLGGVQLITLGIIGEYIGKLFMQAKGRPNYIIKKTNIDEDR